MCKIICFTNRNLVKGDFLRQIEKIARAKPGGIVLREKDLTLNDYIALGERVLKICRENDVPLIIHKFPEAAIRLGIRKVHMPLPDLENMSEDMKSRFDIIGASAHSPEQAKYAEGMGASYVTVSHIFTTDCKKGVPPKGLSLIKSVKKAVSVPAFALGGINGENARRCIEAGADGVCLMSEFMKWDNPAEIIDNIHTALNISTTPGQSNITKL